jgi:hypothetical protein
LKANTQNPRAQRESPNPPRASSASAGPVPRSAQVRQAERDRSEASLGGNHQNPQRTARKPNPPPSLLSEHRTGPAERPSTPSGAGSVQSEPWRRPPKIPRAQRESPILPRASSASAGPIPRSAPYAKRSGIGPERALEAITKIPRAQRESPILPRASSASTGPVPRSAPYAKRSGIRPQRALEAITKTPRAQRENPFSPAPSCERRRGPVQANTGHAPTRPSPTHPYPESPNPRGTGGDSGATRTTSQP